LYDTLKNIIQGHGSTDNIVPIQKGLADIEHHMLHFLENHDEQRIASNDFAGNPEKGNPAMVVSTCLSTSPTLVYFGQHVGEPGDGNPGFGNETRTTIFDYWGVPAHQRWMNNGAFDGGQLTKAEKELNNFYKSLLSFSSQSEALTGHYKEIHQLNRQKPEGYSDKLFSFVRWKGKNRLIVVSNFDETSSYEFTLKLDQTVLNEWKLENGNYTLTDQIGKKGNFTLKVENDQAGVQVELKPLESVILKF